MKKQLLVLCISVGLVLGNGSMVAADSEVSEQVVKVVQQALNDSGFDCGIADGIAGKKTKEAIEEFEQEKGLIGNGTISDELLEALGIGGVTIDDISEGDIDTEEEIPDIKIDYESLSTSQKNAIEEAKSYLKYTSFSKDGLVHQLSSEYGSDFPEEDAIIAVKYLEQEELVDWDEQAIDEAQRYLKFTSFSRNGLIQQLSSEYGSEFTVEQAERAVTYLEEEGLVDWFEQAVKEAESYLDFTSFSRNGLIEQLSSEYGSGFTYEQAVYAVEQVYD